MEKVSAEVLKLGNAWIPVIICQLTGPKKAKWPLWQCEHIQGFLNKFPEGLLKTHLNKTHPSFLNSQSKQAPLKQASSPLEHLLLTYEVLWQCGLRSENQSFVFGIVVVDFALRKFRTRFSGHLYSRLALNVTQ